MDNITTFMLKTRAIYIGRNRHRIFIMSVPRNHRLSSLDKPRDAKRRTSGRNFLSYHRTPDRVLLDEVLSFHR